MAFSIALIMVAHVHAASTWFVDGNLGTNDVFHGTGPGASAFKTIQYAINFGSVIGGDTILVAKANYPESITISKGLTIRGDPGDLSPGPGSNAAILDGSTLGNAVTAVTISQGVSNAIFEGFEIRNYGTSGNTNEDGVSVWNTGTFNVQIRDNYIHDVGYDGILTGNGWGGPQGLHSGWVITRNIIKNFGAYAIDLENTKDSQITNNVVSDPKSTTYGIVILSLGCSTNTIDMSNVVVSGNQINNYPGTAINVMAWSPDAGASATLRGVSLAGNTITSSISGYDSVILAWKTGPGTVTLKDLTIEENIITVNSQNGYGRMLDLADAGGANSLSYNQLTLTGTVGGGYTFFHGVNIGGSSTGTWNIEHNQLNGNNVGADSCGFRVRGTLPATAVLYFKCNCITKFARGIRSDALPTGAQVVADCNNIFGNTQYGISNGAGAVIDARNNWWGEISGPYHSSNPGGTGNQVSDNVLFVPWLKSTACGPPPVGGEWVPIDKISLLTPWIGWASLVTAITVSFVGVKRTRKKQN